MLSCKSLKDAYLHGEIIGLKEAIKIKIGKRAMSWKCENQFYAFRFNKGVSLILRSMHVHT